LSLILTIDPATRIELEVNPEMVPAVRLMSGAVSNGADAVAPFLRGLP
jgi:hypothetical protein